MRSIQQLVMLAVVVQAYAPLRADAPSVYIDWFNTDLPICFNQGNPAHCSVAGGLIDNPFSGLPDEPPTLPIWASAYALSARNALTFQLDFSAYGFFSFFGGSPLADDIQGFGTLTDKLRLSKPVPSGSYTEFDVDASGVSLSSVDYCFNDSWSLQSGLRQVGLSCAPDGRFVQPIDGNLVSISAFVEQHLGGSLVFDVSLPVDVTYTVENIQIFDKQGHLIPEILTPVPEPAGLWLLMPIVGVGPRLYKRSRLKSIR